MSNTLWRIAQRIILSALFAFATLMAAPVVAEKAPDYSQDNSQDNAQQLIELLQDFASMSGEFEQQQSDASGQLLTQSSGVFSMRRPGLLRWETLQPFPQLLVSNGDTLWLYDPDLEQVTISAVEAQLNQSPAIIFSGDLDAIRLRYEISRGAEGVFSLRPHQQEGHFQRLDLVFDARQLVAMSILDGFGQKTDFNFREVDYNRAIADSQFHFTPPPGTDVLRHE